MPRPTRLDDAAITAWLGAHAEWAREGDVITRTYTLPDFARAIAFVVNVGFVAEKMDHHPDIAIAWRKVTLRLSTHDAGGLTALDLEAAERADALA